MINLTEKEIEFLREILSEMYPDLDIDPDQIESDLTEEELTVRSIFSKIK